MKALDSFYWFVGAGIVLSLGYLARDEAAASPQVGGSTTAVLLILAGWTALAVGALLALSTLYVRHRD